MTTNPVEAYLKQHPHAAFSKRTLMKKCGIPQKKTLCHHVRNSKHIRRVYAYEYGCGKYKDIHAVFQYKDHAHAGHDAVEGGGATTSVVCEEDSGECSE